MKDPIQKGLNERIIDLAAMLKSEAPLEAGRLLGMPELPESDFWVDIAGANAMLQVPSRTITSWLARRGPQNCPFPQPHRILYRLYWRASELRRWHAERNLREGR